MLNIARILAFALLLSFWCVPTLYAQEVIVPLDHYPPWRFFHDRDTVEGIDIQLTQALLHKVGLTPRFLNTPWKRCLTMMQQGVADLMVGVLWSQERDTYMYFIDPPYKDKTMKVFYVRKGSGVRITRYEDLQGLTIGTTHGAKYFQPFDSDATLHKDSVKLDVMNVRMLAADRIDCFVASKETGEYLIKSECMGDLLVKAQFEHEGRTKVYFTISRKSWLMDKAPELSRAVGQMVEDGTVTRIISEYLRGM